jgi:tetraacyldisaccharide 4'-kinase
MHEPAFWWRRPGLRARLMAPLGEAYGTIAAQRMARPGRAAGVPVLCVGNFTLGGAGKTPTTIMLAKLLADAGETPFCLSRGYGGSVEGPKRADAAADSAAEIGDEALLLARAAPTIVSRKRLPGAALARREGASVIVMDDGLQNAALVKDFTIAVVDARRGIGNGYVFPAGPLRAPLAAQLDRTDALLLVGEDENGGAETCAAQARVRGLPIWHGRLVPDPAVAAGLKGKTVLAFAGIGDPDKFFATVAGAGITLAERRGFPDHHRFTAREAAQLLKDAEHGGLTLLTTEKDRARMAGDPILQDLAARAEVLPVTMAVMELEDLRRTVLGKLVR